MAAIIVVVDNKIPFSVVVSYFQFQFKFIMIIVVVVVIVVDDDDRIIPV